jgi:hypothetical protein
VTFANGNLTIGSVAREAFFLGKRNGRQGANLSLILRRFCNCRPNNNLPFVIVCDELPAGSLGCGDDFVEALITAQRIPTRI